MNIRPNPDAGPVERPVKQHRVLQPQVTVIDDTATTNVQLETEVKQEIAPEWPVKVKLKKPIRLLKADTGEVLQQYDVMEFREPTAGDIIAVGGSPVVVLDYQQGTTQFDATKMAMMMARLSKIAPVYINSMDAVDFINCATMLQRNFLPDWGRML